MKFEYGDAIYEIKFKRYPGDWTIVNRYGKVISVRDTTECRIIRNGEVISTSVAYRCAWDNPSKEIGRKVSLTRAVRKFDDKLFRRAIWEVYRNRKQTREYA